MPNRRSATVSTLRLTRDAEARLRFADAVHPIDRIGERMGGHGTGTPCLRFSVLANTSAGGRVDAITASAGVSNKRLPA